MKPLEQKDYPLKIVEDLGMQKATETSKLNKRFAEFECPVCNKNYRAYTYDVKTGKSTKCKPCAEEKQKVNLTNITAGVKTCGTCKQERPLEQFYNSSKSSDGKGTRCKTCDNLARKKWSENNPERSKQSSRNRQVLYKYGITQEEYLEKLKSQNYGCAICGTTNNSSKSFSIDHCHKTNKIRGLLCNQCNRGLGMLGDTSKDLFKAFKYLRDSERAEPTPINLTNNIKGNKWK